MGNRLWLSVMLTSALAYECRFSAPDGVEYDLSPLSRTAPPDYAIIGSDNYEYRINVCQPLVQSCSGDFTGIVTQWHPHGNCLAILARENPHFGGLHSPSFRYLIPDRPEEGVAVTYYNGDLCHTNTVQEREVEMRVYCAAGASSGVLRAFENEPCRYVVEFSSAAGCQPGTKGEPIDMKKTKGRGKVIVVFILSVFVGYCVLGMYRNKRRTGRAMIPHKSLWIGLASSFHFYTSELIARLRTLTTSL